MRYKIYDVYNNAWNLGGRLNKYFESYFEIKENGNIIITESVTNFKNRSKMPDIVLRVGVFVSYSNIS